MDLTQKIAERKRERELEAKKAELQAWRALDLEAQDKPIDIEPDLDLESKRLFLENSEGAGHPTVRESDDADIEKETFRLKLKHASAFTQLSYAILLIAAVTFLVISVSALFQGDFFGVIVMLVFSGLSVKFALWAIDSAKIAGK